MAKERENQNAAQKQGFMPLAEKAHGIKNVLQAVKGGIEVVDKALDMGDLERSKRGWGILRSNLEKINKMVLDMLEYARETKLTISRCHVNELVSSVVEVLRPAFEDKGVEVELDLDENDTALEIDAERIRDALTNIIMNAVEAVEADTGKIKIQTRLGKGGKNFICKISDNGPGIEEDDAVFLPFHSSKTGINAGLGLSITKKTIERHGGRISLSSQLGEGAEFTVTLPVNK